MVFQSGDNRASLHTVVALTQTDIPKSRRIHRFISHASTFKPVFEVFETPERFCDEPSSPFSHYVAGLF